MKIIAKLSLLLLFIFPWTSLAEIPAQLKTDFKPISGTIIMPIGDEYLVDLDASVNLRVGDILTLIMTGEKVIHPITKETLGTLDLAKGYFQVTQIKSGYSYIKPLSSEITPQKGDRVKRFEQTPTRFKSYQPSGKLAEELKIALPHLKWLNDTDKASPELIFLLEGNNLKIINSAEVELKVYPYLEGQLAASSTAVHTAGSFQAEETQKEKSLLNKTVGGLSSAIGFGKKDKRLENPGIIQNQQQYSSIWIGPNLDGNPVGISVADFDGDGQLETAVAMEDHLQILRMTDKNLAPVATVNFGKGVRLLSLDTADLDSNGLPELYLSANVGTKLSSQVVEFTQGSYQSIMSRIPWFFRTVDLSQEGRTLIAQAMGDSETPFAGTPFRVIRSKDKLTQGTSLDLPVKMDLFSFVPFQGANNDPLYAYISAGDYLYATTAEGETLWESADHFGGTEVSFYNEKQTGSSANELLKPVYVQQRLLTLPSGDILVAQNEGFRSLDRYRNFNKSRVVALNWNGFAFQEKWKTSEQAGYLADFTLADADNDGQDEIVMAIKFQQKNLLQKGRSTVVIYELNP